MLALLLKIVLFVISLVAAFHVLLRKRDPRAALGWIVFCLAVPGLGPFFYALLGINRVRTRAREWQEQGRGPQADTRGYCVWPLPSCALDPFRQENYQALMQLADKVTRRPLLPGNRVQPLYNGEEAFPSMLAAVARARHTIYVATYIFDTHAVGRAFIQALSEAAHRGVQVCVLIDGLGERYTWPLARKLFRGSGVQLARFLPPRLWGTGVHINLRNHRKLLLIDGELGFTGGMNLSERHLVQHAPVRHQAKDVHFRVQGPVLGQMLEAFNEDWHFATGKTLPPPVYPPALSGSNAFCRGISAGPNEEYEKLLWLVGGIFNSARDHVRLMTPYFIPTQQLIGAINSAALRGVTVEIILPERNNLPYVAWASQAYFWEFLQYGVKIYHQPPPFCHSKLLLMDNYYCLVGSANMDPRSLRLNFEFNMEVYDGILSQQLRDHFDAVRSYSQLLSLAEVDSRRFGTKVRDAAFKLMSPYL